jgi:hypothetical protein
MASADAVAVEYSPRMANIAQASTLTRQGLGRRRRALRDTLATAKKASEGLHQNTEGASTTMSLR